MTARDLAERLRARPTGPGRWLARCPAHADHRPSLSVGEGDGGRALLRCWAGCRTADVLAAAGLAWRDISAAPTTSADRARMRRDAEQREGAETAQRRHAEALAATGEALHTRAGRIVRRMAAIEWAGDTPAYPGEADALEREYHAALAASREIEAAHAA